MSTSQLVSAFEVEPGDVLMASDGTHVEVVRVREHHALAGHRWWHFKGRKDPVIVRDFMTFRRLPKTSDRDGQTMPIVERSGS